MPGQATVDLSAEEKKPSVWPDAMAVWIKKGPVKPPAMVKALKFGATIEEAELALAPLARTGEVRSREAAGFVVLSVPAVVSPKVSLHLFFKNEMLTKLQITMPTSYAMALLTEQWGPPSRTDAEALPYPIHHFESESYRAMVEKLDIDFTVVSFWPNE